MHFIKLYRVSRFSDISITMLEFLEIFPTIKDIILPFIKEKIDKVRFWSDSLNIIKKFYPELYEEAKESSIRIELYEEFDRIKPYYNYMNSEKFVEVTIKKEKVTFEKWLSNIYNKFLSNKYFQRNNFIHRNEQIVFIVILLAKLDKLDTFKEFKNIIIPINYLVRLCFNLKSPVKSKEFILTESESESILTMLSTIEYEDPMEKHLALSLAYYEKGWGFENYLELVKNEKSTRMLFMKHILSYLIKNDRFDDAVEIIDIVLSWKMSISERSESLILINSQYKLDVYNDRGKNWLTFIKDKYPIK